MNPRIAHIVEVKPYSVTVEWTNGEKKLIDFADFLADERNKNSVFSKLFVGDTFMKVQTDGRTLYWDKLIEMEDTDGKLIPAPLDFCPDVLYQFSKTV